MKTAKSICMEDNLWKEVEYEARQSGKSISGFVADKLFNKGESGDVDDLTLLNNYYLLLNNKLLLTDTHIHSLLALDVLAKSKELEEVKKHQTEFILKKKERFNELEQLFTELGFLSKIKKIKPEDWKVVVEDVITKGLVDEKGNPKITGSLIIEYHRLLRIVNDSQEKTKKEVIDK